MKSVAGPNLSKLPAETAEFAANPLTHSLDAFRQPGWAGAAEVLGSEAVTVAKQGNVHGMGHNRLVYKVAPAGFEQLLQCFLRAAS